jgi:hypothetical protein
MLQTNVHQIAHSIHFGSATETPELVILDHITYRLVKTTKRLTFDILYQTRDPRVTWYGEDDGDFHSFRASNGYEVISRSVMDIQTERLWLLGASKEDRAERSGSMVFGSDEKRDKAYENFHQALREWNDNINEKLNCDYS